MVREFRELSDHIGPSPLTPELSSFGGDEAAVSIDPRPQERGAARPEVGVRQMDVLAPDVGPVLVISGRFGPQDRHVGIDHEGVERISGRGVVCCGQNDPFDVVDDLGTGRTVRSLQY